jgi:hypothetical protein
MIDYIKESNKKAQDRNEYMLFNVPVYVINKFPSNVKINNILDSVKDIINKKYLDRLDAIYIGDFKDLNRRDIQSMLKDGAIWISSNNIKNIITEPLVVENIIHEIAHLLEEKYQSQIYGDGKLEREYNSKKNRLFHLLKNEGYDIDLDLFFSDDMLKEFDNFLYKIVGYDKISLLTAGLFLSPYSITTIREYFASGMLDNLTSDDNYIGEISPVLYSKIKQVKENLSNEY